MYEVNYSTEKQSLTNGDSKLTKNQFTKSLTSFHTKKTTSKNISNQNPPKKSLIKPENKSVKNKRVYLSSKKAKALNYLKLNSISPQNNLINDLNKQIENEPENKNKLYNAPSSVQRSYKYQNCYILNNLNNYQPHVIPGSLTKTKNNNENKYIDKKLSESIEKYDDNDNYNDNMIEINNNNNSYTTSENRKTNGASSNINENVIENNSLIQPSRSINGLNTITFNINNNYNNCYNNYGLASNNINNSKKTGFIQFNGYMNLNGYESINNKSVDIDNIISKEKALNKLEESDKDLKNININIETDNKQISNKRSTLFKGKSKNKTKQKPGIYSNTTNTNSMTNFNINNFRKSQKTINLNEKNENNYNKNYIYETMDNIVNNENTITRTKNIYKFNKFNNNKKIALNKRNFNYKENEIENTKSLNSLESSQKNQNNDKKLSKENKENENPYQTYSGSFRNNNRMIKVNMVENKKSQIDKINNEINNDEINLQKNVFKNNNKSTSNLKTYVDKYENKNSFGCKKFNKKNNSQSNKKINIINNNKTKFNEKNKNNNNKNILMQTYNNFKKAKDDDNINIKEDLTQTNYNDLQTFNSNELQTKSVNCLNCYTKKNNIIPLTRENSITYVRKKSLNMKVYNKGNNNNFLSSRPSAFKHKKNYSISSSCYNTQRNLNDPKIDSKKNSNKKSNVYSPKNDINKINLEEKTIVMPEYKIKLENIKSRINNLLNIYSLLALRALKVPSGDNGDKVNKEENMDKNEEY